MGQEVTGFGPDNNRTIGSDGTEYSLEKKELEAPHEIVDVRGKKYYKIEIPGYTLRTFYSHSTEEAGPGPGWDFKTILLDDERSIAVYGRTFTEEEVFHPEKLPDVSVYRLEEKE